MDIVDSNGMLKKPDLEIWRSISGSNGRLTFKADAHIHYHHILPILRDAFPIIAETRHKKNIDELLIRIFKDKQQNREGITKDWLSELFKIKIQNFIGIANIVDYPFSYSLKIDRVIIMPFGGDDIENFIEKNKQSPLMTSVIKMNELKMINGEINAMAFCKTKTYDDESCKLSSFKYINRVLHFIKLIDGRSEIRLDVKNINCLQTAFFVADENNILRSSQVDNIIRKDFFSTRIYNNEDINLIKNKAAQFFFKHDINDLQTSILSALYWYGKTDVTFDDKVDQFISYINGLERLVLFDTKQNKAQMFANRLEEYFSYVTHKEMFDLYKKRNKLLHEYEPDIYEEDLMLLRGLLGNLLKDLIDKSDLHHNLYSFFNH